MLELHIMDSYQMLFPTSSSLPSTSVFPFSHSVETSHADYYNKNSTNLDCSGDRNERPFGVRDELSSLVGNLAVPQNEEKLAAKMKQGEKKKMRKPRYAFQTRSQVDILDDGYRWRKYGQKAVKNNKFPRSYYRCTYQGCNVKKQVQRLTKDEGVVVTTYEGVHTHSIDKPTDNFEHILNQMRIYTPFQGSYATEITRRMHGN